MELQNIKPISKKGTEILNSIVKMAKNANGYFKLDNTDSVFMPLSIDILGQNDKNMNLSICHYGEQNGDLMRDPEMCFLFINENFYPYYFRNDYTGSENESLRFDNFMITGIRRNIYKGHLEFAEIWLKNIKHQQEI